MLSLLLLAARTGEAALTRNACRRAPNSCIGGRGRGGKPQPLAVRSGGWWVLWSRGPRGGVAGAKRLHASSYVMCGATSPREGRAHPGRSK